MILKFVGLPVAVLDMVRGPCKTVVSSEPILFAKVRLKLSGVLSVVERST